ncbi:MAG TPA: hypothetical protein VF942_10760 [Acidimicrobiales bacterium]
MLSNNCPVVIDGFRSELAASLFNHQGGGVNSHVTIRNVQYAATALGYGSTGKPSPGAKWIHSSVGTSLVLEQVFCWDPPAGVIPTINLYTQTYRSYPSPTPP